VPTPAPGEAYATVAAGVARDHDCTWDGGTLRWCKGTKWWRCLDLVAGTGARLGLVMEVATVPAATRSGSRRTAGRSSTARGLGLFR